MVLEFGDSQQRQGLSQPSQTPLLHSSPLPHLKPILVPLSTPQCALAYNKEAHSHAPEGMLIPISDSTLSIAYHLQLSTSKQQNKNNSQDLQKKSSLVLLSSFRSPTHVFLFFFLFRWISVWTSVYFFTFTGFYVANQNHNFGHWSEGLIRGCFQFSDWFVSAVLYIIRYHKERKT